MSKIEAGRLRLDLEEMHVDAIVGEALRVMSVKAEEKRLKIAAEVAPGLLLRCDRRALKQILLNLIANAVKFTPEGGRVAVRAREAGGHLFLRIEDSGIGISRAALQKLGRPFEQVESHISKTHTGTGLGLAIAKSLVELHRGRMRIHSVENIGTAVILRLPVGGPVERVRQAA
jgi:two-component system cell cycle sensor histidine kinase PleC